MCAGSRDSAALEGEFSGIQSPGERFCAAAAVISLYLSLVSARRGSCEPELGEKVWSYTR